LPRLSINSLEHLFFVLLRRSGVIERATVPRQVMPLLWSVAVPDVSKAVVAETDPGRLVPD